MAVKIVYSLTKIKTKQNKNISLLYSKSARSGEMVYLKYHLLVSSYLFLEMAKTLRR